MMIVAPFTGAWIEIVDKSKTPPSTVVAPFTGAWIEIYPIFSLPLNHTNYNEYSFQILLYIPSLLVFDYKPISF